MIYEAVMELKKYLTDGLQSVIEAQSSGKGVTIQPIRSNDFVVGWSDPFSQQRYPICLIVPDMVTRDVQQQLINLPVWLFFSHRGKSAEDVTAQQLIICDSILSYLNEAEIGTLRAYVNEVTPYTPVSNIGVVEVNATIQIDILGGL
jgi:hypothetical protein